MVRETNYNENFCKTQNTKTQKNVEKTFKNRTIQPTLTQVLQKDVAWYSRPESEKVRSIVCEINIANVVILKVLSLSINTLSIINVIKKNNENRTEQVLIQCLFIKFIR